MGVESPARRVLREFRALVREHRDMRAVLLAVMSGDREAAAEWARVHGRPTREKLLAWLAGFETGSTFRRVLGRVASAN